MSGSILKEVTFTPQSFDKEYIFSNNRRFGKLISILESLIESGIVVAVSNTWIDDVHIFLKEYEDNDKDEIISLLEMLSRRNRISVYPNHKKFIDEALWISEIDKRNQKRRFDFAAGTVTNSTVTTIEKIDSKAYLRSGGRIKKQTMENIKKLIAPILSYAEIVKIYDPYFKIEKNDYFDVLELVCQNLGDIYGDNNEAIIDIHTSIKTMLNNKGEFDWSKADIWIRKIKYLENKYNHQITIKIWEQTDRSKWHDRWLITDQCGVYMGKGSDKSDWTDATWGSLEYDDLPLVEDKFIEGKNFYHYIGSITSNGVNKQSMPKTVSVNLTDEEQKSEDNRLKNQAEESEKLRLEKLKNPKKLRRRFVPLSERDK